MKKHIYLLILLFTVISCKRKHEKNDVEVFFNQTSFDREIIQNLPLYNSIKDIAVTNLDTIFKFSNSRHIVDVSDENGKIERRQEDQSSCNFSYDFKKHSFFDFSSDHALPSNIEKLLSVCFDKLGAQNIGGFSLYLDSAVEIAVKGIEDKKSHAEGSHSLIWKTVYAKNTNPNLYIKDTVIGPGWTYQIYLEQKLDGGWPR
jgi:hypothetical protein